MSAYRSAIKAGFKHSTAWNAASRVEKACNMKEFLAKNGIDDDTIVKTLKSGLKAKKKSSVCVGKDEYVVEEVPDHPTRHKYLETALELRGDVRRGGGAQVAIQNNNSVGVQMPVIKIDGKPLEFDIGS